MKSKIRLFLAALLSLLFLQCKAPSVIPSSSHNENNTAITVKTDTVLERDSIFIDRWQTIYVKGDTVFVTKEVTKYRDRFRYRTKTDTFIVERTDSVLVPYPVEKVVTNTPTRILGWSLLGNALVIVFCLWRLWVRFKRTQKIL